MVRFKVDQDISKEIGSSELQNKNYFIKVMIVNFDESCLMKIRNIEKEKMKKGYSSRVMTSILS